MAAEQPEVALAAMRQRWNDVLFLSWPVPPRSLAGRLPGGLELDLHEDEAWLSIVALGLDVEPPARLPLPALSGEAQVSLRTCVRGPRSTPGIFVFSADVTSSVLAAAARASGVPYTWSDIERAAEGDRRQWRLYRRAGGAAEAHIEAEVTEWLPDGARQVLDRYLTERFHVYSSLGPALLDGPVEHPQWRLHRVSVTRCDQTLTSAAGLAPPGATAGLVGHWSPGVEVEVGVPRPARLPRPGV